MAKQGPNWEGLLKWSLSHTDGTHRPRNLSEEAALRSLLELAQEKTDKIKDDEKLKQILQKRIERISLMSPEDLGAAKEERQLVDALWSTCYGEPSPLQEKGLLLLPGEDVPPT